MDVEIGFVTTSNYLQEEEFKKLTNLTPDVKDNLLTYSQRFWRAGFPTIGLGYRLINGYPFYCRVSGYFHGLNYAKGVLDYYVPKNSSFVQELTKIGIQKKIEFDEKGGELKILLSANIEVGLLIINKNYLSVFLTGGLNFYLLKNNNSMLPSIGVTFN